MSDAPYPVYEERLQTLDEDVLRQQRVTNKVG